jgi:hypothetical protein
LTDKNLIETAKIKEEEIKNRKLKIKTKKNSKKEKNKIKENLYHGEKNIESAENEDNLENNENSENDENYENEEDEDEDYDALENIRRLLENENMTTDQLSKKLLVEEAEKEEELLLDRHNIIEMKNFKKKIIAGKPEELNVDFNQKTKRKRIPSLKILEWNFANNKIKKILEEEDK